MSERLKEIKVGKAVHFTLDEKTGFWMNHKATDPMSATMIDVEVIAVLADYLAQIKSIKEKLDTTEQLLIKYVDILKQ